MNSNQQWSFLIHPNHLAGLTGLVASAGNEDMQCLLFDPKPPG
jgi:hypothetical protein